MSGKVSYTLTLIDVVTAPVLLIAKAPKAKWFAKPFGFLSLSTRGFPEGFLGKPMCSEDTL